MKKIDKDYLASCLLMWMFPRVLSELESQENRERLVRGISLVVRSYIACLMEESDNPKKMQKELDKMGDIAKDFFSELVENGDKTLNSDFQFIAKFLDFVKGSTPQPEEK